jgi:SAM-dependent methyltransferase
VELPVTGAPPEPAVGHEVAPPSDWVRRWAPLLPPSARVLDLACGHGRHVRWLAAAGHRVTALDRDETLLAPLATLANVERTIAADIEAGPWPLAGAAFDAVVVTNYLWRALFPALRAAVAPGGLLVYETFAQGHEALGRPRRPEFLLRPGELLEVVGGAALADGQPWRVIAFEQGRLGGGADGPEREVQRIVARRLAPTATPAPTSPDRLCPPG